MVADLVGTHRVHLEMRTQMPRIELEALVRRDVCTVGRKMYGAIKYEYDLLVYMFKHKQTIHNSIHFKVDLVKT